MKSLSHKILDQIPIEHIYKYLSEKENASKKQNGGKSVGTSAASRKARQDAIKELTRKMAL
ncbi:hypothetical protein J2X97_000387 [Epilithonimonas hungarica]|uniref:hypothetical protein n=1 Tax=Epilithonimonas hungarica TaxID=454006 RepID=UPI0027849208|nr:hypothetical protein [Epilithonimonas hungarica]MDP9954750.1 hypothetical protein [Epilithonimonas hungarica]